MAREFDGICADLELDTSHSFIALAAPSLEGKTQSAFTFRRVKPLYFPMSAASSSSGLDTVQPIYNNFRSHAVQLQDCVKLDLDMIGREVDRSDISASKLSDTHKNISFWTLGFLSELAARAREFNADLETGGISWMEHLANIERFIFSKKAISDIQLGTFSNSCIFLDEYMNEIWAVFVRNLARAVGIKCLCANTNTKIANIIGKDTAGSGSGGWNVWSLVAVRLNPPCKSYLNESFNLEECINAIKRAALLGITAEKRIIQEPLNPVCRFLRDFMDNQLNVLRPGVAVYVAKAFMCFVNTLEENARRVDLGELLDFVAKQLFEEFKKRKPSLFVTTEAMYAKAGLFLPESYYNAKTTTSRGNAMTGQIEGFFNSYTFLEHHLYYLKNPQVAGKWLFLLFPPAEKDPDQTMRTVRRGQLEEWSNEYTHFEPAEILTIMACQFIPYLKTVHRHMKQASLSIESDPRSVHNSPNPSAFKLPSNPLEVSAAVSVVDSTQHAFGTEIVTSIDVVTNTPHSSDRLKYSFSGQRGTTFIKNLIINLITDPNYKIFSSDMNIHIAGSSKYSLKSKFLDICRIPCLYAIDREIPIFESLSDPRSGFFLSNYSRSSDEEHIDGSFKFFHRGLFKTAVIECKHWRNDLGTNLLFSILCKAVGTPESKLCIIFCKTMVERAATYSTCFSYCRDQKINVYRVSRDSLNSCIISPLFRRSAGIFRTPKMICIVLESDSINDPQYTFAAY